MMEVESLKSKVDEASRGRDEESFA